MSSTNYSHFSIVIQDRLDSLPLPPNPHIGAVAKPTYHTLSVALKRNLGGGSEREPAEECQGVKDVLDEELHTIYLDEGFGSRGVAYPAVFMPAEVEADSTVGTWKTLFSSCTSLSRLSSRN